MKNQINGLQDQRTEHQAVTAVWHNSGVAGFESSHKLINFGVR